MRRFISDVSNFPRMLMVSAALSAGSVQAGALAEDGGFGGLRLQSASLPVETYLGISLYNRILNMNTGVEPLNSLLPDQEVILPNGVRQDARLWASDHVAAISLSSHRFIEAHVALPMYSQDLYYGIDETRNSAIGDMRYGLKLAIPVGGSKSVLAAALLVGGSLPTSGNRSGVLPVPRRLEYYPADTSVLAGGSRSAGTARDDWHIGGAITLDLEQSALPLPVQLHVNAGSRKTSALTPDDEEFFDVFAVGGGFEGKLSKYVSLLGEYWHERRLEAPRSDKFQLDEISAALAFHTPIGISFVAGAGFALNNTERQPIAFHDAIGTKQYEFDMRTSPTAQIILALTYTGRLTSLDRDKDGILDKVDKCPDTPGMAAWHGCPNPDKDADKVCDPFVPDMALAEVFASICQGRDKCPDVPGLPEYAGCPLPDRDGDGIPDDKDQCPDVPGVAEWEGCPPPDQDKDGLCDPWVTEREMQTRFVALCQGVDKCPTEAEDKDGFEDEDGCPDPDNDKDGIPDVKDKCPNEPETFNAFQDEDGCPDVAPVQQKTLILRGVNFETGKATLLPESYPVLDDVAAQLVAAPEIEIEVSGHTDNVGGMDYNLKLSQDRAQTVASHLIAKGVASNRLQVKGYGYNKPIASNRTASGRLQNRRVEFNRIDKGPKQ